SPFAKTEHKKDMCAHRAAPEDENLTRGARRAPIPQDVRPKSRIYARWAPNIARLPSSRPLQRGFDREDRDEEYRQEGHFGNRGHTAGGAGTPNRIHLPASLKGHPRTSDKQCLPTTLTSASVQTGRDIEHEYRLAHVSQDCEGGGHDESECSIHRLQPRCP